MPHPEEDRRSVSKGDGFKSWFFFSILLTAPLEAWAIAVTADKVLAVAPDSIHDARDAVAESKVGVKNR